MKHLVAPGLSFLLAPALVLALAVSAGCNKQPEPIPNEKPAATTTTSSAAPASSAMPATATAQPSNAAGPDDIGYDAPAAWASAPNPSTMRKATFKIPKAAGDAEDAELAVSSAAGGVDANIKRWEQQFGDAKAKTEPRTINGLKVTVVEIKGKIASGGMMGAPPTAAKESQMLLGAIVDAGDKQHFFKMVGGEKTVTAAKKDFDKFVSTFRAK